MWKPCTYKNWKRSISKCTVLLSIWQSFAMCKWLAHLDSSMTYWTDYCQNYVHWLQTDINSTSCVCGSEHVNVMEKFWLYKLWKNLNLKGSELIGPRKGSVLQTFVKICVIFVLLFFNKENVFSAYSERPSSTPMQNNG